MNFLAIFVSAALLLVNVEGAPNNCAKTYRELLQDLITLKGSCDTAGYRDCCQVLYVCIVLQFLLLVIINMHC